MSVSDRDLPPPRSGGGSGRGPSIEIARVAVANDAELRKAEEEGRLESLVKERVSLPTPSGKNPLDLLLHAAEDLCVLAVRPGVDFMEASDLAPFVLPRLAELLDPDNEELRFVLAKAGEENVAEHTIKIAVKRGVWPTNGSRTLEAAVLPVKLAPLARAAVAARESLLLRWRS